MSSVSDNKHLSGVFAAILPAFDQACLQYWVYGGVGIAGLKGKFIRPNDDVDIYVMSADFEDARQLLWDLCERNKVWKFKEKAPLHGRPKVELWRDGKELLSMVPVYETDKGVELRLRTPVLLPREHAFTQEPRQIGGYSFFSPPESILKRILRSILIEQRNLLTDPKSWRRVDAMAIFSTEELTEIKHEIE